MAKTGDLLPVITIMVRTTICEALPLIFIPHIHTSSLDSAEACPQQCQQSTLLTEGSRFVQRGEHTRAADSRTVASAELSDPLNDHNTLFFSTLCSNAVHTGPVDVISLWCLVSIRAVSLSLSLSADIPSPSFITHTADRVRPQRPIDHCWCYLCLPWGLSLLLLPWARPPHPDQTIPSEPENQVGARILLSALEPAPGQELPVTVKIYGARGQVNRPPPTTSTATSALPHSQEELLFKQ